MSACQVGWIPLFVRADQWTHLTPWVFCASVGDVCILGKYFSPALLEQTQHIVERDLSRPSRSKPYTFVKAAQLKGNGVRGEEMSSSYKEGRNRASLAHETPTCPHSQKPISIITMQGIRVFPRGLEAKSHTWE